MALPTGTVTFLFTDVVGSTDLWERHPDVMKFALRRHDEILHTSIESHRGSVFKTVGDAYCAVFADASDAVVAAIDIQRRLLVEPWSEPVTLSVRIGLHTGTCEERDGDYFGPSVNRAARLEAVAHGGQIVLSSASAELVRGSAQEFTLNDLGEHRLRDLGSAVYVYQVLASGLVHSFPSLRSLDNDNFLNNLPIQLTSFIGRLDSLRELREAVAHHRLVTLTGAGGSGKTRLSLQCAAELVGSYADGVWFVDLASITDPSLVPVAVASAMGMREGSDADALGFIVAAIAPKSTLVVLDNCEHLIDECVAFVDEVLHKSTTVSVIATSREPLGVSGERVIRVNSLNVPDADDVADGVDAVARSEAVLLFLERARSPRAWGD